MAPVAHRSRGSRDPGRNGPRRHYSRRRGGAFETLSGCDFEPDTAFADRVGLDLFEQVFVKLNPAKLTGRARTVSLDRWAWSNTCASVNRTGTGTPPATPPPDPSNQNCSGARVARVQAALKLRLTCRTTASLSVWGQTPRATYRCPKR